MVTLVHLVTILSILFAVVSAEDVKPPTSDETVNHEKWLGFRYGYGLGFGQGIYGFGYGCSYNWLNRLEPFGAYGVFNYYPSLWLKEVAGGPPATRRSIDIQAEHIFRRDAPISCKNQKGHVEEFVPQHCEQAVHSLVNQKSTSASCQSCAVQLVTPTGQLAVAAAAPAEELVRVVNQALKFCNSDYAPESNHSRRSPAESSPSGTTNQQFALIIRKGDGKPCNV